MVWKSGGCVFVGVRSERKPTDTVCTAYKFPKAQERLEELKKGGSRAQKNKEGREKLSRKEGKDSDCAVM